MYNVAVNADCSEMDCLPHSREDDRQDHNTWEMRYSSVFPTWSASQSFGDLRSVQEVNPLGPTAPTSTKELPTSHPQWYLPLQEAASVVLRLKR